MLRGSNEAKMLKLFEKFEVRKYALKVCYLGHNYDGMACQAEADNSIEEYIFKVMHTLSLIPKPFPADDSFTRAGRTDKGVSAMGNVISLNLRTDI
jgi:tRNA pseudouridine38/39 synthase